MTLSIFHSMSVTCNMELKNACCPLEDSCVHLQAVGRGLSPLMAAGEWSVTGGWAVALSFAGTAGNAITRVCVKH